MASEDKLREASAMGARAKALLDNELLQMFFTKTEATLFKEFKNTPADDTDQLQRIRISTELLSNLKKTLELLVSGGEASSKQLLNLKKPTIIEKVLNR